MTPSSKQWTVWALLLSLTGCISPQPSSNPSEPSPTQSEAARPEPGRPAPIAQTDGQTDADIWSQLQEADTHYYVLMRHAIAPGTGDPPSFDLQDCSTQRNLSEEGLTQARRTGELFRQKNVAAGQVLSSEWCRCLDTATQLALGPVEPFPTLNSFFENRAQGPERTERLQAFMAEHKEAQQVTVMVTHFVNISAIAGSGVASGEMVVMRYEQNQLQVVGRIEAQ